MSAEPTVVARHRSIHGGRCSSCRRRIRPGEPITKVWDGQRGHQTKAHQGPGRWVCDDCAPPADAAD